ncbi:MAG: hypothetical protein A2493_00215 [Candidatus Magasanikbacteria bacterium RIFOXYC12_FULL_33_11]|uniref:Uncharacterized protein n=1 Tax=Candidatus Magasanikbacteria bacterium RIFOXYC12_FULL_33_11 TaxID=1798701 RepID=A0A1F6NQS0_9BACT|nr:MAG: hypothetical protein A2493_00215 [Candidatus Magasanikbacteria bacterium RIFOXYC12_FULL_33_11]
MPTTSPGLDEVFTPVSLGVVADGVVLVWKLLPHLLDGVDLSPVEVIRRTVDGIAEETNLLTIEDNNTNDLVEEEESDVSIWHVDL